MKTKRISTRASGFTLVELLTVIAIVSVLAALVLVTINKIREAARGTQNLANHRTIAAALLQSAYDNKGSLPYFDHGSGIKLAYPRYLAERGYVTDYRVFFSPKAGTWYDNYQGALRQPHVATVVPWYFTNYGANRYGAMPHAQDDGSRRPAMLSRIEQPAKLMLLRDTYRAGYDTEAEPFGGGICFFSTLTNYIPPPEKTFGGKVHAAFADGHVKAFDVSEINRMASRPQEEAPLFRDQYTRN